MMVENIWNWLATNMNIDSPANADFCPIRRPCLFSPLEINYQQLWCSIQELKLWVTRERGEILLQQSKAAIFVSSFQMPSEIIPLWLVLDVPPQEMFSPVSALLWLSPFPLGKTLDTVKWHNWNDHWNRISPSAVRVILAFHTSKSNYKEVKYFASTLSLFSSGSYLLL